VARHIVVIYSSTDPTRTCCDGWCGRLLLGVILALPWHRARGGSCWRAVRIRKRAGGGSCRRGRRGAGGCAGGVAGVGGVPVNTWVLLLLIASQCRRCSRACRWCWRGRLQLTPQPPASVRRGRRRCSSTTAISSRHRPCFVFCVRWQRGHLLALCTGGVRAGVGLRADGPSHLTLEPAAALWGAGEVGTVPGVYAPGVGQGLAVTATHATRLVVWCGGCVSGMSAYVQHWA
jgi:hypothetical protein